MPLCSLFLVALQPPHSPHSFLASVRTAFPPRDLLLIGIPQRWIIRPGHPLAGEELLSPKWDVVLVLKGDVVLDDRLGDSHVVAETYRSLVGIPSSLVEGLSETNRRLWGADVPPLTGSLERPKTAESTQDLEATDGLIAWSKRYDSQRQRQAQKGGGVKRAVTMLNFLKFKQGMKAEYLKYGKAFADEVGSRRGGVAKIVGSVINKSSSGSQWDEVALAHYPTSVHFADMAASEDYQSANQRHRIPALEDTCILCVAEVDVDEATGEADAVEEVTVTSGEKGRSWETKAEKAKL